jgi:hypothetical protein
MAEHYAQQRIREALLQSHGNEARARQLIMQWALSDHRLLQMIAQPHLSGIVAHAVNRVANKKELSSASMKKDRPAPKGDEQFGKELLKNFAMGQPVKFSEESFGAPLGKRQASQKHIEAIHQLARKHKPH